MIHASPTREDVLDELRRVRQVAERDDDDAPDDEEPGYVPRVLMLGVGAWVGLVLLLGAMAACAGAP